MSEQEEKKLCKADQATVDFWNTYQRQARETLIYPYPNTRLYYLTMGFVGELYELREKIVSPVQMDDEKFKQHKKDVMSEMGDVLWYAANIFTDLEIPFGEAMMVNVVPSEINYNGPKFVTSFDISNIIQVSYQNTGLLCGAVKKVYRDDDSIVTEEKQEKIFTAVIRSLMDIHRIAVVFDIDLVNVAANNLSKLAKRKEENKLQGDGDNR